MPHITIRAVGKLHEPWKGLAANYAKRLSPFAKLTVKEVSETRFHSVADRERVLAEEGRRLLSDLPHGAHIVALSEHGKTLDTPAFAEFLKRHDETGQEIVFLLGGPLGISERLRSTADRLLSLSPMTFTHEMARVILLEQLYRAATILKGKTYHY